MTDEVERETVELERALERLTDVERALWDAPDRQMQRVVRDQRARARGCRDGHLWVPVVMVNPAGADERVLECGRCHEREVDDRALDELEVAPVLNVSRVAVQRPDFRGRGCRGMAYCLEPATEVHHWMRRELRGELWADLFTVVPVCRRHHELIHAVAYR